MADQPVADEQTKKKKKEQKANKGEDIPLGQLVSGVVIEKNTQGVRLRLEPSQAVSFLWAHHLSDHENLCPQILELIQEGATLGGLLALSRDANGILVGALLQYFLSSLLW